MAEGGGFAVRAAVRARILLATLCLLALATSASADCAWVLWEQINAQSPEPKAGFSNNEACQADLKGRIAELAQQYPVSTLGRTGGTVKGNDPRTNQTYTFLMLYTCLPDTIDPRGPKGK
jgi:hypothetical protein